MRMSTHGTSCRTAKAAASAGSLQTGTATENLSRGFAIPSALTKWPTRSGSLKAGTIASPRSSGTAQRPIFPHVIDRLPAYPSRMSPAFGGGMWLTCFTSRRRLVEFVLREDRYRHMMMEEVDPRFWVAPMLSSGQSFLEPLQGGNVKTLGISKPWAPPRSYGLVVRLGPDGIPKYSLHSRSDGHHHGIVSAVEANGVSLSPVQRGWASTPS